MPPVFDAVAALAPGAPILHEDRGSNLLLEDSLAWGDIDEGFRQADRIFEETYSSPSMFHHPMEPVGGCLAHYVNGEANIWLPTSSPMRDAAEFAHFLGIEPDKVRVRVPYVGGGFGSKIPTPAHFAALFLSRKIGRPVRLIPSAEDSFRQNSRHAEVFKAKVGVKADGTFTALDVDLVVDTGAYTTGGATAAHNSVISAWGCYRIPHLRISGSCVYTNKVPAGHTRATGKIQTTWGIECTMDSVARQLGIDPYEFRKKNVLLRGDFVCNGTPRMDTDYLDLMAEAIAGIGWDGKANPAPSDESGGSRWVRGRGMALSLRHGSQGGGRAYALVTLDARGRCHDPTQCAGDRPGHAQSIQRGCGADLEHSAEPDSRGHAGHRGEFALRRCQRTAHDHADGQRGAQRLQESEAGFAFAGGASQRRQGRGLADRSTGGCAGARSSFSISEIIRALGGSVVLKAVGYHSVPPMVKDSAFAGMDHWAPSGAAVDLEVNRDTGELRILGYAVIADAGKTIHYPSAKAQVDGGAVMGFGHALFEETIYQDGQLQNGDPFQYRLPVMKDIPEIFIRRCWKKATGRGRSAPRAWRKHPSSPSGRPSATQSMTRSACA